MLQPSPRPATLTLLCGGLVLGAVSWWVCPLVSARVEPYDSGSGLIANQLILMVGTLYVALR